MNFLRLCSHGAARCLNSFWAQGLNSSAICLASKSSNSDIARAFVTLSSRGPGHRPFTAVTRVRIPLGSHWLMLLITGVLFVLVVTLVDLKPVVVQHFFFSISDPGI